jgi:hypothetical protein
MRNLLEFGFLFGQESIVVKKTKLWNSIYTSSQINMVDRSIRGKPRDLSVIKKIKRKNDLSYIIAKTHFKQFYYKIFLLE